MKSSRSRPRGIPPLRAAERNADDRLALAREIAAKTAMHLVERTDRGTKTLLSVVVPVFNERENLPDLLSRIHQALRHEAGDYEIIIVDDRSEDGTTGYLETVADGVCVRLVHKQGKRGKSSSLQEGFRRARGSIIAMIDADLQYPPEAIPGMMRALDGCDIVVARRTFYKTGRIRSLLSRLYRRFFGHWLLGLGVDVQSGLKVFRHDILDHLSLRTSAWGFDYQFLYRAKRLGCRIGEKNIVFEQRHCGQSHVNSLMTGLELSLGALWLRLSFLPKDVLPFLEYPHRTEYRPKGFKNTEDYLFLPEIHSSKFHVYRETVALGLLTALGAGLGVWGLSILFGTSPLIVISGALSAVYLGLIFFKLYVVWQSGAMWIHAEEEISCRGG